MWRIAGLEKAVGLRAIRSLVRRGEIQETLDKKRVRLPGALPMDPWWSPWEFAGSALDPPLDDELAKAVLERFGVPERGGADRGTPMEGGELAEILVSDNPGDGSKPAYL